MTQLVRQLVDQNILTMDDYFEIIVKPYVTLCRQHGIEIKDTHSMAHAAIIRHAAALSLRQLKVICPSVDTASLEQDLSR